MSRPVADIVEDLVALSELPMQLEQKDAELVGTRSKLNDAKAEVEVLKEKLASLPTAEGTPTPPVPVEPDPIIVVPPIVMPPSGFLTRPNSVQNMYEVSPGVWATRSDYHVMNAANLGFALGNIGRNKTVTVKAKRKTNVVYGSEYNFKPGRMYPENQIGGYPNWYAGTQKDGSLVLYVEKMPVANGVTRFYTTWPKPTGDWMEEIWKFRPSSKVGKSDGMLFLSVAGRVLVSSETLMSDNETFPGVQNFFCLQGVNSPESGNINRKKLPTDAMLQFKDIQITVS